jgi:hypothetical protein
MNRNLYLCAGFAVLVMAGCSGETKLPEATGKGSVMAINAISTSPPITFMIEERAIASVAFKNASAPAEYDDLDYTFSFEALLPPDPGDDGQNTPTRIARQHLNVVADTSYAFVVSGSLNAPAITVWESPRPVFGEGATNFEVQFGHVAGTMGDFDVYFDDPVIAPALGNEIGTLTFGQLLPARSLEAGDYKLTLTAAGEPANILFESATVSAEAGTSLMFNTFDTDANDLSPVSVHAINRTTGANAPIADANYAPRVRFVHANSQVGTVDIYVEEPIDDPNVLPLVTAQVFRDITAELEMPTDNPVPFTYTTAGNIGAIHIDSDRPLLRGTRSDYYLIEIASGDDVLMTHVPDRRSVETLAKITIFNTAAIEVSLDIYIVTRDIPIDEVNPVLPDDVRPLLAGVPIGVTPLDIVLLEGDFDLYVTANADKVAMAGPIPLDLLRGDVVEFIIYENVADPTVVDVVNITLP